MQTTFPVIIIICLFSSVSYFVEEIKSGRTPNPDVICNQKIKFYSFFDWVKNNLGIETIATGHYARVDWTTEHKGKSV